MSSKSLLSRIKAYFIGSKRSNPYSEWKSPVWLGRPPYWQPGVYAVKIGERQIIGQYDPERDSWIFEDFIKKVGHIKRYTAKSHELIALNATLLGKGEKTLMSDEYIKKDIDRFLKEVRDWVEDELKNNCAGISLSIDIPSRKRRIELVTKL